MSGSNYLIQSQTCGDYREFRSSERLVLGSIIFLDYDFWLVKALW